MDRPEVWWQLLGPSKFIVDVATAIRSVPVVAVAIPDGRLPNYMIHIASGATELDGYLTWTDVHLGDGDVTTEISSQILTRNQAATVRRPSDLVGLRDLAHEVISIGRNDVIQRFDELITFAASFAAAAAHRPNEPRPTLLLDLPADRVHGGALAGMGKDRVRVLPWRGYVSRHDMIYYVSHLMVSRDDSPLTDTLLTTVISYIAGWDPVLASIMAEWEREQILDAWPCLQELASPMSDTEDSWEAGTADEISGNHVPHALWLAKRGLKNRFNRLVWTSHLVEIFPWLEARRLELIDAYGDKWKFPIIKDKGPVIRSAMEMELGEIFYNLVNAPHAENEDFSFVEACKDARHDLAHRRSVSNMRIMQLERQTGLIS